jgi:general secretion pathway protein G
MNWLAEKPGNYMGEYFNPKSEEIPPGSWYFDLQDRSLAYALNQSEHFTSENGRVNLIRFRLKILYEVAVQESDEAVDKKNIGGIVLQPDRPYYWF